MLSFLFFIIIFVFVFGLVIILSVLGFIRSIFGSIFGFGRRKTPTQDQQQQDFEQPASKQKIFTEKEGEYVDYEEVD
jgi:hypothetical protein